MPIRIVAKPESSVAILHCFGELSPEEISKAISFAFTSHLMEPGQSRVVILDPDAELHDLDGEGLRRIRQSVLEQELRGGQDVSFHSVFVHTSPIHKNIVKLYKAIWDELNLPGVQFSIVTSEEKAWRIIGAEPPAMQRESV